MQLMSVLWCSIIFCLFVVSLWFSVRPPWIMYVIQSPLVHIISLISSSFWVRFNPEIKILWFQLYSVLLIKKKTKHWHKSNLRGNREHKPANMSRNKWDLKWDWNGRPNGIQNIKVVHDVVLTSKGKVHFFTFKWRMWQNHSFYILRIVSVGKLHL